MVMIGFWAVIERQLKELAGARSADDVIRILASERNPYGGTTVADGFFAGGGGDESVYEVLIETGWKVVWFEADYHYCLKAPDGSMITYVEGDIYRGNPQKQQPKREN